MKKRHVFAAESVRDAEAIVQVATRGGVSNACIRLEARSEVEIRRIDDERKNVSMDFVPAALRGTLLGALAGFLAGLVAMYVPIFGISLAGAGALAIVGALVGTWASVLMGSALPDEIRRTFADEIDAGQVLVVIDADALAFAELESAITQAGGRRLPYESTSALT